MSNFADIANKKIEDVERPPLPPIGNYIMAISKPAAISEVSSDKGHWDVVDYFLQGVQALEGVDEEALVAFDGAKGVRLTQRFMYPRGEDQQASFAQTEFREATFVREHLGMSDVTLGEARGTCVGMQVMVELGYRPGQRPDEFYAEVKKTAPVT